MPTFSAVTISTLLNHLSGSRAAFNRLLAHAGDSTWASIIRRKCEERPIRFAKLRVGEVSGHQLVHIFRPAWIFGSVSLISPTFISALKALTRGPSFGEAGELVSARAD